MTTTITDDAAAIGAAVHAAMWQRRITQTTAAAAIGKSQTVLSKKLRGDVPITAVELVQLARLMGVDAGTLLPRLDSNQQPSGYRSRLVSAVEPAELERCPRCGAWMLGACPWCSTATRGAFELAA